MLNTSRQGVNNEDAGHAGHAGGTASSSHTRHRRSGSSLAATLLSQEGVRHAAVTGNEAHQPLPSFPGGAFGPFGPLDAQACADAAHPALVSSSHGADMGVVQHPMQRMASSGQRQPLVRLDGCQRVRCGAVGGGWCVPRGSSHICLSL